MKFISPDKEHRYIRKLAVDALDIEFNTDFSEIEKSDKAYIIWNPYGYLVNANQHNRKKHELYTSLRLQGRPVYVVERGALPNSIFIDNKGFLCNSHSYAEGHWNSPLNDEQLKKVDIYINSIVNDDTSLEQQKSPRLTREEFFKKLNINESEFDKIVFVPLQYHNDTVIKLWADWIKTTKQFRETMLDISKDTPKILYLFKNHPIEDNPEEIIKVQSNNVKIVDEFHYKDCVSYCDSMICINSGIGLQAMMWKKPVILVGHAFYQFDGINQKANNREEIISLIMNPLTVNWEKVQRFIYYLRYVFYSFCFMRNISKKASEPTLFESITYETPDKERIIVENKNQSEKIANILFEFIDIVKKYALMKITCLDCIRYCSLETNKENLYIATELNESLISTLKEKGYIHSGNSFVKDGITVHIEKMPLFTKVMSLYERPVLVPKPVVKYLTDLYGANWLTYKQIETPIQNKLNIVYSFNLHGWVFEFESLYYKRFTELKGIPMLERDLKQLSKNQANIVIIPSAWHYRDLTRNGTIAHLKNQGIKIVAQYNSHITTEIEHRVEGADLVVASSPMLYQDVKKRHNFDNLVMIPHFVDIEYFQPEKMYNNFTVGWAGNFKNTYKRPEIFTDIISNYEGIKFMLQTSYKESLNQGGRQQEMPTFYNHIDILLITSKSEGTPMPLLEAMSCGKMVLSTRVGLAPVLLNPEFIIDGSTDEEIRNNFIKKLSELQKNPSKIVLEGQRNRDIIVKNLSWQKNYKLLDEVYRKLYRNNLVGIKLITKDFQMILEDNLNVHAS